MFSALLRRLSFSGGRRGALEALGKKEKNVMTHIGLLKRTLED